MKIPRNFPSLLAAIVLLTLTAATAPAKLIIAGSFPVGKVTAAQVPPKSLNALLLASYVKSVALLEKKER